MHTLRRLIVNHFRSNFFLNTGLQNVSVLYVGVHMYFNGTTA